MHIAEKIKKAFFDGNARNIITDEFIKANNDPLFINLSEIDLKKIIPIYMLWCTNNPDYANLTHDYTINAIAECGRSKKPEISHLSFKFKCNQEQSGVVVEFLEWCLKENPFANKKQIERSIKNWKNAANPSINRDG